MDRGMVIFVGALLTFTSSWLGLVMLPFLKLEGESAYVDPSGPGEAYPRPLQGLALAGKTIYQREGCLYCHTQQVRSEYFGNWWENGVQRTGADIKRGWGVRRTVARDYIHDHPVLLGTMRTGPDLATIGRRNRSYQWQHTHLLNPRSQNAWSVMPSFPWLYRREKIVGERSQQALDLGREWTVQPGYRWRPSDSDWQAMLNTQREAIRAALPDEAVKAQFDAYAQDPAGQRQLLDLWLTTREEDYQIVPTRDGDALYEYLLALDKNGADLPEAKE